jgi:hypothetical protein
MVLKIIFGIESGFSTAAVQRSGREGFDFEPLSMPMPASLGVGKAGHRNLVFRICADLKDSGIHAASAINAGMVKPGAAPGPDAIAEQNLTVHSQRPAAFKREAMFRGA